MIGYIFYQIFRKYKPIFDAQAYFSNIVKYFTFSNNVFNLKGISHQILSLVDILV